MLTHETREYCIDGDTNFDDAIAGNLQPGPARRQQGCNKIATRRLASFPLKQAPKGNDVTGVGHQRHFENVTGATQFGSGALSVWIF